MFIISQKEGHLRKTTKKKTTRIKINLNYLCKDIFQQQDKGNISNPKDVDDYSCYEQTDQLSS